MRLLLVRLPQQRCHLIWTSHHILLDGWSTSQLLGEVLDYYAGKTARKTGGRYRDYIAWLQDQNRDDSESFWRRRLVALDEPTRLADAVQILPEDGHGLHRCCLDAETLQMLQAYCRRRRITVNTLLQGAWALLLQRYCGQSTVAFGATVSGRSAQLHGIEQILGLFINTLPLIVGLKPEQRVGDALRALQDDNLALREHEQTPLYDIQRWAGHGGAALFDSLLVFENFPVDDALRNADSCLRFGSPTHVDTTHYPLTLNVSIGDTLGLVYGYWKTRFDAAVVERLSGHFLQVLLRMTDADDIHVGELTLPDDDETRRLAHWNATARRYPSGLIPELISRRALQQPEATALQFGDAAMTYGELERQANRLAHRLMVLGVGPEAPVGIAVERSLTLVVGLLAIIKAGGAYLPLDPDYPPERLAYMVEDSGLRLLLSHAPVLRQTADAWGANPKLVCVDLDDLDVSGEPETAPKVALHPEHPAYIIYTSGSTGRPKGATNSHAALGNRLHWMQTAYPLAAQDTVLQKTPYSFDVSVWEFFWPLMAGASLAIAEPGAHRDPARLAELMIQHQVTTLHFVPSMLAEFVNQGELPPFPGLKRILCSGEALPAELQQRVFQQLPDVALANLYGPTEAAIDVTYWNCCEDGGDSVPIGEPIGNTAIHILDSDLNPLPIGVAGELYIAGRGLARGYHRRPGLTAECFLPDPSGNGGRLYRTGDRARRRADGVLEYLGRLDHQVKLRGQRIELGEIEAALLAQQGVNEAAVLLKDSVAGPQLVAYLVAEAKARNTDGLLRALRRRLPDYMLPANLLYLDNLPKTANGKLDRKALPEPHWSGREYLPPATRTEQRLATIWQLLLGAEQVGLQDNFFELGGHSLLATRLVSQIRSELGINLPLRALFETESLQQLAEYMDATGANVLTDEHLAAMDAWLDELEMS